MGRSGVRMVAALALLGGAFGGGAARAGEQPRPERFLESNLVQIAAQARAEGSRAALEHAEALGLAVEAGRVRVVLDPQPSESAAARAAVRTSGGLIEAEGAGQLQALVPAGAIGNLPGLAGGAYVRSPLTPRPAAVTGEGVAFTRADVWQNAGLNGAGVDVAIIDLGFAGLQARQAEGELPASTTVVDRCPGRFESTDHGVGVAEVVHELAPGARLHLICIGTEIELLQALEYVAANGIAIVNHSVIWYVSSRGDGTGAPGTPEHTVARARQAGVLWVNAAGNAGEKHWSGVFTDGDADSLHEFSGNDERNRVMLNPTRNFCASLKWDEWPATDEDYDLLLRSSAGELLLAQSTTVQDGTQLPREGFCWQNETGSATEVYLEIKRIRGTATPRLDLYSTVSGRFQYQVPEGSIVEPATSPAALAVGAVCWHTGLLEAYSSRGPTIDGRTKPDLVAAATVSNATYGAYQDCAPLTVPGFRGTSAAAPHVAAAAALVKQVRPALGPAELTAALLADTTDLAPSGPDPLHGAGSFALRPLVPVVATAAAAPGVRYAHITGSVDTRGLTTSYVVEYGATGSELRTAPQTLVPGANPTPITLTLEGLAPATALRYRIIATNVFGTVPGELISSSTLSPSPPLVGATAETGVRSATVSATVDPRGEPTSVHVEYGPSAALGRRTGSIDAGRGVGAHTLALELPDLEPGTSYQYRVIATSPAGTASASAVLTTQFPPAPAPARPADLVVSLAAAPEGVFVGGSVGYRALVTNRGGAAATGVRLALTFPAGATIESSSTERGSCQVQAPGLVCEIGFFPAGHVATVLVQVRLSTAGDLDASVVASLDGGDPTSNDNRAVARVGVRAVVSAAVVATPLRLASPVRPRLVVANGSVQIRGQFSLSRAATMTVTLLDARGRRVSLLAGSTLRGTRLTATGGALTHSVPSGRSTVTLRLRRSAPRAGLRLKLVARAASGLGATILVAVRR